MTGRRSHTMNSYAGMWTSLLTTAARSNFEIVVWPSIINLCRPLNWFTQSPGSPVRGLPPLPLECKCGVLAQQRTKVRELRLLR